ncbi:MAG: hypothetical protein L6R40_001585 [Gallowayella cf. fulva]|nr:MAG: hypothetical protein L6R40_001585 [Xanthomendoza cf. fulva]
MVPSWTFILKTDRECSGQSKAFAAPLMLLPPRPLLTDCVGKTELVGGGKVCVSLNVRWHPALISERGRGLAIVTTSFKAQWQIRNLMSPLPLQDSLRLYEMKHHAAGAALPVAQCRVLQDDGGGVVTCQAARFFLQTLLAHTKPEYKSLIEDRQSKTLWASPSVRREFAMSFGWSVSDIAKLMQLAYKTAQGAKAACGQYDELTREISSLHIILNRLHVETAKPGSPINKPGGSGSHGKDIKAIAAGCEEVLTQLEKILLKYNALSEQERSVRKLWKKIRFGNGAIVDVAELRSKVTYYTSSLSLFLNLVSVGTIGDVEKKMDQAGGDLKDIKDAVNHLTAHLLATEGKEGSVLTTYTNDDRDAWRELRRGLVKAGFRGSLVRKYMTTIMAYVKELGDNGVLDDIVTEEAIFPIMEGDEIVSSSTQANRHINDQTAKPDYDPAEERPQDWTTGVHRPGHDSIADSDSTLSPSATPNEKGEDSKGSRVDDEEALRCLDKLKEKPPDCKINLSPSGFLVEGDGKSEGRRGKPGEYQSKPPDGTEISNLPDTRMPSKHDTRRLVTYQDLHKTTQDFLSAENMRYHSSTVTTPFSKTDSIFLDDTELPAFIAGVTSIFGKETYIPYIIQEKIMVNDQSTSGRTIAAVTLLEFVQALHIRLLSLRASEASAHLRSPDFKAHERHLIIRAMQMLYFIEDAKDMVDQILMFFASLDSRQITTLCSMFAVDLIRGLDERSKQELRISRGPLCYYKWWLQYFDRHLPEALEQLRHRYGDEIVSSVTSKLDQGNGCFMRAQTVNGGLHEDSIRENGVS